jgi:hypothetical protein
MRKAFNNPPPRYRSLNGKFSNRSNESIAGSSEQLDDSNGVSVIRSAVKRGRRTIPSHSGLPSSAEAVQYSEESDSEGLELETEAEEASDVSSIEGYAENDVGRNRARKMRDSRSGD